MTNYNPNQEFSLALERIKEATGLELTVLEKWELRRYVKEAIINRLATTTNYLSGFNPWNDAVSLFLYKNYDIPVGYCEAGYLDVIRFSNEQRGNLQGYYDFFRKMQEDNHLL